MQKYNVGDRGTTSKGFQYRVLVVEVITTWVDLTKTRVVGVVVKILNTSSGADGMFTYDGSITMPGEDIATYYFPEDGSHLTSVAELKFGKLQPKTLKIKGYANFYPNQDVPALHATESYAKGVAGPTAIAVAVPVDFDVEV